MRTALRALLAIGMTVGFFILWLVIIAALIVATVWAAGQGTAAAATRLAIAGGIVVVTLVSVVIRVARTRPGDPEGPEVSAERAPALWAMVRELAERAETKAPDRIVLDADVNAGVMENARLLGLIAGRRTMVLGVPLLMGLSVDQLRSVLAHELGHYSGAHTRLGPMTYRSRGLMVETVNQLRGYVVRWIFRCYAVLCLLVSASVARRQELEADALSVQAVGRAKAQETLRELPVLDGAWNAYLDQFVTLGWEDGFAPAPKAFFAGFDAMLRARRDELDELRAAPPHEEPDPWDSHPPIDVRLRAMADATGTPAFASDSRPATILIGDFADLAATAAGELIDYGDRTPVDWPQFESDVMPLVDQHTADVLYRAVARVLNRPGAGLAEVLEVAAQGMLPTVGKDLWPPDGMPQDAMRDVLGATFRAAAVKGGVGAWRLDWTSAHRLERPDGSLLDLDPVLDQALNPRTVDQARAELARLGIRLEDGVVEEQIDSGRGAQVVGGLANVKVDGKQNDVLILDAGLLLRPCNRDSDAGRRRLEDWAQEAPGWELARRYRFVPFEEIERAQLERETPLVVELGLRDGTRIGLKETWTGLSLAKDSHDILLALLEPVEATPTDPAAGGGTRGSDGAVQEREGGQSR